MTTVGLGDVVPETYTGGVITFLLGWSLTGAWGKLCKPSLLISVIYLQRIWEIHQTILAPHIVRDWSFHGLRGTHPVSVAYLKGTPRFWHFKRILFGLKSGPSKAIDMRLGSYRYEFTLAFIDNIVTYSRSLHPQSTRPEKKENEMVAYYFIPLVYLAYGKKNF